MLNLDSRKSFYRTIFESSLRLESKLRLTRGLFASKNAYILAAGPSLNSLNFNKLKDRIRDSLVICIKQSYLKLSGLEFAKPTT